MWFGVGCPGLALGASLATVDVKHVSSGIRRCATEVSISERSHALVPNEACVFRRRHRHRQKHRHRHTDTQSERERERDTHTHAHPHTLTHTQSHTRTHAHRQHTHTRTHTHTRESERERNLTQVAAEARGWRWSCSGWGGGPQEILAAAFKAIGCSIPDIGYTVKTDAPTDCTGAAPKAKTYC